MWHVTSHKYDQNKGFLLLIKAINIINPLKWYAMGIFIFSASYQNIKLNLL